MPYRSRITTIKESIRLIENTISDAETKVNFDKDKLANLKEKKIQYNEELSRLERAQWEYERETVDFGDD